MRTPISDFLAEYAEGGSIRMHMPGHKGAGDAERYDLTEIVGADSLYEASGIIAESEANASALFGAHSFYSCEGSSLSIRAMVYLAMLHARSEGREPRILAFRNCHKSFVSATALLGVPTEFLRGAGDGYLSTSLPALEVESFLDSSEHSYTALYITSPDYLGRMADISALSELCKKRGMLLLVDNAHGAYLKFLSPSLHPMDLGADMCADSAHKTLPVLTGGGYLHINRGASPLLAENAKYALSLFGSTSPSYLILASLDRANAYISGGYPERVASLTARLKMVKERLSAAGYEVYDGEPMKLTLLPKSYGKRGDELAGILAKKGCTVEFADRDHLVLMPSAEQSDELDKVLEMLLSVQRAAPITDTPPALPHPVKVIEPRDALCAPTEWVRVEDAEGRIMGELTVGCPPAVPILMLGERIDREAIACFKYYGTEKLRVVKE